MALLPGALLSGALLSGALFARGFVKKILPDGKLGRINRYKEAGSGISICLT
jgi:hypothetical protein